jgi:mannose-1-phosphate guanylyltransferase/mannose-6-phosphate isomerase
MQAAERPFIMSLITPVILVGGSGKRLWPLSRESMPKQFVPLLGKQSTFQQTLMRVTDRSLFARPVIATNEAYRFMAESQAREIGMEIDILVEPSRRDSGPAMAAAAAYCQSLGAKAVLALASDHLVIGAEEFLSGCRAGLTAVEKGGIVTFGIPPTEPKTDYGYIRPGSEHIGEVQKVAAFVEKPDAKTALRYIAEGLLWNSGNFLFPPALLLSEMTKFEPAMAEAAQEAVARAKKTGSTVFLDADAFARAPAKSIDYAVMERTDKCWVVPAKFRWSDLGTWDALLDVGNADSEGNVTEGKVEIDHVRNSYVRSDGPLTAVIGVEDVVVVAMHDAVLVGHRNNLPRLKNVVERMAEGKHRAATEHVVMHRPWGSYQDIDRGERFRAKRLTVVPRGKLSLQSHNRRAEHWVVVKGTAEVTLDGKIMTLHENESVYIPIGGVHRLANPGSEPLEVVEVQTGDYLEEDDIVRYEDIYARV